MEVKFKVVSLCLIVYVDLHSKVYLLLIKGRSCDHCRPRLTFGLFFVVEQSNFDLFAKRI